ncbi:MAG: hypothetical protein IH621_17470 [Krumholzibacteria bacterium]|nr:hypothetical protein [Candidatus Krumholzibacteria bacterium]
MKESPWAYRYPTSVNTASVQFTPNAAPAAISVYEYVSTSARLSVQETNSPRYVIRDNSCRRSTRAPNATADWSESLISFTWKNGERLKVHPGRTIHNNPGEIDADP